MKVLLIIFLALCIPLAIIFLTGLTLWALLKLFWIPIVAIVGIRLLFSLIDAISISRANRK